ncbi:MAG TPA: hypothetical protein VFD84_08995 [Candidatus Binatia bacterium]|nr:hypothetical protein [Candidatus Binatia bacterium]
MNQVLAATVLALALVVAAWLHATRSVIIGGPAAYVYEPRSGKLLYCDAGEYYAVPPARNWNARYRTTRRRA